MVLNRENRYAVIDDFFSIGEYLAIKNYLEGVSWDFTPGIAGEFAKKDPANSGFAHLIYGHDHKDDNPTISTMIGFSLSRYFKINQMWRIRAGLLIPVGKKWVHDPHVDKQEPHWTALMYFSSEKGAGHTYIFDELYDPYLYDNVPAQVKARKDKMKVLDKVEAKENRVVFMRGDVFHSSSAPETIVKRMAINVNFLGVPLDVQPEANKP